MFAGYIALGGDTLEDTRFELVNTGRALAYVDGWNAKIITAGLDPNNPPPTGCIDWLDNCDDCAPADDLFTDGAGYTYPESDPAPWYDPNIPDSEKFLGVIGLDVVGAEDSTRSATVVQSITGGGVVGKLNFGPRTMVVRALAVAVDSCGMEVGLNWLRCQYETTDTDNCTGDNLWFLDCCPSCIPDPDSPAVGPCWPDTYGELATVPPPECPPEIWWPSTYGQILTGPPEGDSGWCAWIEIYRDLRDGLPEYSCDIFGCLEPYVRNFQNVRVVEGPIVLRRQVMHNAGEIAEIEFTIVAADPHEYTPMNPVLLQSIEPTTNVVDAPAAPEPVDPFETPVPLLRRTRLRSTPTQWRRQTVAFPAPAHVSSLSSLVGKVTVGAGDTAAGAVRVGLWRNGELLDGFTLPHLPAHAQVEVDGRARRTSTLVSGISRQREGFAVGYDGGVHRWAELPADPGEFVLTVDQEAGAVGDLAVEFAAAEKGCA